ncbi:chromate transporter [Eubacteriales bacterium OttesenSCG-928-M02]|nr:chromate transporter [Eubacteriales bacterium OttesenSCG-928-M02]
MEKNTPRKASWKELFSLFWTTFKIGAVTFGGGYVIIPMLQREFVQKYHYIEESDILDIVAISQSLPGVISINACIMVGYRAGGVRGALMTSLGVTLPSLITISIISYFYLEFAANIYVAAALRGIRAGVVALMIHSVINLAKPIMKEWVNWIFFLGTFVLSFQFSIHAILLIVTAGLLGIVLKATVFKEKGGEGNA